MIGVAKSAFRNRYTRHRGAARHPRPPAVRRRSVWTLRTDAVPAPAHGPLTSVARRRVASIASPPPTAAAATLKGHLRAQALITAEASICPWRTSLVAAAHLETAQRACRPSNFSILRRSRLVGRPVPRSRAATTTASSRDGGGGLLSI